MIDSCGVLGGVEGGCTMATFVYEAVVYIADWFGIGAGGFRGWGLVLVARG